MDAETVRNLSLRAKQYSGRNLNEAQTKTTLVKPFISALGYDIHNPFEVSAEFVADKGTKRGEKIDYAILRDNVPAILIECKALGATLDEGKCSQLRRYFQAAPDAKIGILTDGIRYMFFSDINRENIMDDKPFMEIDLLAFNEQRLPELQRMTRASFDIDVILRAADSLQCFREFLREFSAEIEMPSNDFIRFFASRLHQGRVTAKALEFYAPIFRQAVDEYFNERLNQRLESSKKSSCATRAESDDKSSEITPTNTEMWGLVIIRTLLYQAMDSARIFMRKSKSYCAIILDDNNRKTICRFYNFCEWRDGDPNIGDNAHVVVFSGKVNGEKFPVRFIDDLYPLKEQFMTAARMYK
jgi:hypothetical protein